MLPVPLLLSSLWQLSAGIIPKVQKKLLFSPLADHRHMRREAPTVGLGLGLDTGIWNPGSESQCPAPAGTPAVLLYEPNWDSRPGF